VRRAEAGERPAGNSSESEELKRLKRENAELRRANEILKAASRRVSDGMLQAAAEAVGGMVDVTAPGASLLPQVENLREVSATATVAVAVAVAEQATQENLARADLKEPVQEVQDAMWQPAYKPVRGQR
jgi:malic enzyme